MLLIITDNGNPDVDKNADISYYMETSSSKKPLEKTINGKNNLLVKYFITVPTY